MSSLVEKNAIDDETDNGSNNVNNASVDDAPFKLLTKDDKHVSFSYALKRIEGKCKLSEEMIREDHFTPLTRKLFNPSMS